MHRLYHSGIINDNDIIVDILLKILLIKLEKTMQYYIIKAVRDWCNNRMKDKKNNSSYKQKLIDLRDACTAIIPHFK